MEHRLQMDTLRLLIRPLTKDNVERLRILRNQYHEYFFDQALIEPEQQANWYRRYCCNPNDYMFQASFTDAPKKAIGFAALYEVNETGAKFGRLLIDHASINGRKGVGEELAKAVCDIGTLQLSLPKITLEVMQNNTSAIDCYSRIGFTKFDSDFSSKIFCMQYSLAGKTRTPIQNIYVGMSYEKRLNITAQLIEDFATVSGDFNPIHVDDTYAAKTRFGRRIGHGIILDSLISNILGNYLPGNGSIFVSNLIEYKAPFFIGDTVTASVTVTEVRNEKERIFLDTMVVNQEGTMLTKGKVTIYYPQS